MEDQTISDELQHGEGYRLGHSGQSPRLVCFQGSFRLASSFRWVNQFCQYYQCSRDCLETLARLKNTSC